MSSNGVSKDAFELYRDSVNEKFTEIKRDVKEIRGCNERIEKQVKIIVDDYNERKKKEAQQVDNKSKLTVGMKLALFGIATSVFSALSVTSILILLGWGR